MKTTILSLFLVLLIAGCSRKPAESTTAATPAAALPQFTFAATDLASPAAVATNRLGGVSVDINLSGSKADELYKFTMAHLNHQVQIMCGPKVLITPVIYTAISNGKVQVTFGPSSATNAQVVADLLNHK
jgi:preprotein translocase subunit SecD